MAPVAALSLWATERRRGPLLHGHYRIPSMFREHLYRAGLLYFSPHLNCSSDPIVTDRHSAQLREFVFVEMASAGDADKAITEPKGYSTPRPYRRTRQK